MVSPVRAQLAARHMLAGKTHYQINNVPSAAAIADTWVVSLCGDGPSVRSGHPDPNIAAALENAWAGFYETADAEGVADLGGIISSIGRSMVTSGDGLALLTTSPRGELRVRVLAPEQLDPSLTREIEDMSRIIAGVEFDATGRRVAYHIYPQHPELSAAMASPPVRIPAEDIIHLFRPDVPGQVRGTSWFAPVLLLLQELSRLEDALLARANTAALFGGFVTDPEGTSGFGEGGFDPQELSMEPGALRLLPPAATISFPNVPDTGDAPALIAHLVRSIASGVGLPPFLVSGDFGEATYSSAKIAIEASKRRVTALRASLLDARLLRPLWRRFVLLEISSGRLQAPGFYVDPEPFFTMSAAWPAFASIEPLKETQADVIALQAGLRSRAEIIAARGRDISDVDVELAADTFPRAIPARPNLALVGGTDAD
jgi:lambda family phage portal protein